MEENNLEGKKLLKCIHLSVVWILDGLHRLKKIQVSGESMRKMILHI